MGKLTTHVLDTAAGRPAANVAIELYRCGATRERVAAARTNADGRCERPLLEGDALAAGEYELEFAVADYFRRAGAALPQPPFLGIVVIRFAIAAPGEHYH